MSDLKNWNEVREQEYNMSQDLEQNIDRYNSKKEREMRKALNSMDQQDKKKTKSIDKKMREVIEQFIDYNGPVISCKLVTETRTLILQVETDDKGNSKISRRIK